MTESQNKQRRPSGQARGLRARNRTRSDNQNSPQSRNNNANRQRRPDGPKNGAKAAQRRKPARARNANGNNHNKLDSELDFRNTRPASLQQQIPSYNDTPLFSQTAGNGNRAAANRRGKSVKNGQTWTPSDGGGIYVHEQRNSDWYREDQARYAARQIALENAELRNRDPQRRTSSEAGTAKRPQAARNRTRSPNGTNRPRPAAPRRPENGAAPAAASAVTDRNASNGSTGVNGTATSKAIDATPIETIQHEAVNSTPAPTATDNKVNGTSTASNGSANTSTNGAAEPIHSSVDKPAAASATPAAEKPAAKPAPRKRVAKPKAAEAEKKPTAAKATATKTTATKAKADAAEAKPKAAKKTTTRTRKTAKPKDADKPAEE